MRKTEFANEEYYHIYNRGVDKREVFMNDKDYVRFLTAMKEFNRKDAIGSLYEKKLKDSKTAREDSGSKSPIGLLEPESSLTQKLVEIICYCLNPNHYHFILKQLEERGVERFMHKVGMGYTNYFNAKNKRSGSLFQGPFQSIHVDSNEYLLYLSAYVNANHFIHGYDSGLRSLGPFWSYSSLPDYLGKRNGKLCGKEIILGQFDNDFSQYEKYLNDNALYFKEKKEMEKYILE